MNDPKKYYKSLDQEYIKCPVCSSNSSTNIFSGDRYNMGLKTRICNSCSLIYLNPRPSVKSMEKFYSRDYRKYYESIEYPTEDYIKNGVFVERAKKVMDILTPFLNVSKTLLDIGCAEGTFLKTIEMNHSHIETQGIEPNLAFGDFANKNIKGDVFIGGYKEFIENSDCLVYDVITMSHVLEHILDPIDFLNKIKDLMNEKTVLYIEVPNIMDRRVKGIGSIHIGHVISYDRRTLQILLEKCGFEVVMCHLEDLPALTPSMAVTAKIKKVVNPIAYPSKKEIKNKIKFFKSQIEGNLENDKTLYNRFFHILKLRG